MSRTRESVFDRWFLAVLLILFLIFGGSARVDGAGLVIVRTLAIAAIALALPAWWGDTKRDLFAQYRPLVWLLAATAAVMLLYLVPLPPGLWSALPGHGDLAEKMVAAGVPIGWRPLSLDPDRAIHALLDLLVPAAVLLAVGKTSASSLRQLPLRLLAFLAVAAVIGILQPLAGSETALYFHRITNHDAAVGFFANRNHHALFLSLYWPMLLWFLFGRNDRVGSHAAALLGVFGGLFLLVAIMAAGSRAGIAVGGISFVGSTLLIYRWRDRCAGTESAAKIVRIILLAALAGGLLAALALVIFGSNFVARVEQNEMLADIRVTVLPVLTSLIRDYAPFGTGFGSFEAAYKIAEPVDLLRLQYLNHAHNDYIELLIEGGLPALVLLFSWALLALRTARRGWRHAQSAPTDRVGIIALLAVLAILATGSLFDYPLRTPALAAIAMLATALLFRRPDLLQKQRRSKGTAAGFR